MKLQPEEEGQIVALFAAGESQFRIAAITGNGLDAVRRVLRDYRRGVELWPRFRAKPSVLAEFFGEIARINDDEELELYWPVPKVPRDTYETLVRSGLLRKRESLVQLREFTEEWESVEALQEALDRCRRSKPVEDARKVIEDVARKLEERAVGNRGLKRKRSNGV